MKEAVKYLPNAMVGKDYAIELERLGGLPPLRIGLGSLLGLVYEPDTGRLRGSPKGPGEYDIVVLYDEVRPEFNQTYRLIVNPNPSDLWNNRPSGEDDANHRTLHTEYGKMVGAMRRGKLHAHYGEPSDDAFEIAVWENAFFAAVADGAGSAKYSRAAARLAANASVSETMRRFQNGSDLRAALTAGVEAAKNALEALQRRYDSTREDGYTTLTLLCAVKSGEAWRVGVFSVGDGGAAAVCPQNFRLLTEKDSGDYCGQTLFLQHEVNPASRITEHTFAAPIFLVMATDGLLDPLGLCKNADRENWVGLKQTLRDELALDGEKIVEWLGFHARGHHDDRTLVVLTDVA